MAHKQDIALLLCYYSGAAKIRNTILRFQHKQISRFVMFHDIPPEAIRRFESHMLFLKTRANVISMDDFFSNNVSLKKINVVITFDDGYKSWISNALPILKKLQLPATFFISSGFIGLSEQEASNFIRHNLRTQNVTGGLDIEDVKILAEQGFGIGGHGTNHKMLSEIDDISQLRQEIIEDKERLEKIVKREVDYFAYPFGDDRNSKISLADLLREIGYKGAVTTKSGLNMINGDPYHLHRELTFSAMAKSLFKARVSGSSDLVQLMKTYASMKS